MPTTTPLITHPSDASTLFAVGDTIRILRDARPGDAYEVFELVGPETSGPPPHAHEWDESYVLLDGSITVGVEGEETPASAGDFVHIPAGNTHWFRITSPTARFLVITAGHRASDFFEDMHANAPHGLPTPDSLPAIIAVAKRHGLTSPLF